jgi:hypothetical protein
MDSSAIPDMARISARTHVVSTTAGGEVVILDPAASRYYSLDGVGEFVWGRIQDSVALLDLRDAVVARYDVAPDMALTDLKALLHELSAVGLIDISDAPPH